MNYSIGIDIGTTTVKGILFGEGPAVAAEASREYRTISLHHSWAEQDPLDWWNGTVYCIRTLLEKSRVNPADIKVISVSSQAPCALPLNKAGNPLHNALIWMDRRSAAQMKKLAEDPGTDRIFEITGNRLDTYFMLPELMWLLENEPVVMARCHKLVQVNGFINTKLTGTFTIDESHASLTELCDYRTNDWSDEILRAAGVDRSLMPEIVGCCEPIGCVTQKAAEETGLATTTVVLGGAVDATAAALEVGVTGGGKVAEITGTSSVVIIGFDRLVTSRGLSFLRGCGRDDSILFGAMNSIGGSLKWFRDAFMGGETPERDAYDRINRLIESETKGPAGLVFLPYLTGERSPIWDADARGTFIGLNSHTRLSQMARAVMEGGCFALRDNLDQVASTGISFDSLVCCGGCSKSNIWLKIKASVIQKEIQIPEVNLGAPVGLAYMNAAFMGEYASPQEASKACMRIRYSVEPEPSWIGKYEELYQIYLESYQALRKQFTALKSVER